jgi:hypothetical protein
MDTTSVPRLPTGTRPRLVYILAASHSGSTLLALLLGSHPDVCTIGELKATSLGDVERYRCSCHEELRRCPFWTGLSQDMAQRGWSFDVTQAGTDLTVGTSRYVRRLLRPLHHGPFLEGVRDAALALSPTWRTQLPRIQALNAALVECVCDRAGAKVIVDSSKVGLRLKYLLRAELDIRVIRLIRDGRAVALTYTDPATFADARDPRFRGGGMGGDRHAERLPPAEAAREWRRSNEEADAIVRRLDPARWLEVRYETLCTEPESTLRRIFAFMGVDATGEICLTPRPRNHHVLGNGMRLDHTIDIRLDDRWRSGLAPADLAVFEAVAGALNRRLGYR